MDPEGIDLIIQDAEDMPCAILVMMLFMILEKEQMSIYAQKFTKMEPY